MPGRHQSESVADIASERPAEIIGIRTVVIDRDIWATAHLTIKEHGESAWLEAALQSDRLLANGDVEGARSWRRVSAAIAQLQADKPSDGTTAH